MRMLLSTNTDEGGARICVEHWIRLLRGVMDIYFLSAKGHKDIGVHPYVFKHHSFSNEWAIQNSVKICDNLKTLPSDTIIMEINNASLWSYSETLQHLMRFKKRITFNNVAWIDGVLPPEHTKFIRNYISYGVPRNMRTMMEYFYHFTNIVELVQYVDYDFLDLNGDFAEERAIDLLTSFRKNSNKVSSPLMKRLTEDIRSAGLTFKPNYFELHDHGQYLAWIKSNVRGYLHFQDQWIETFGYALYEGIKLCDFVIYKPEPYCDKMIQRLPQSDQDKIIRVESETELAMALIKKDFLRFPKTHAIVKDVYMDRNYVQSRMLSILRNLHEG